MTNMQIETFNSEFSKLISGIKHGAYSISRQDLCRFIQDFEKKAGHPVAQYGKYDSERNEFSACDISGDTIPGTIFVADSLNFLDDSFDETDSFCPIFVFDDFADAYSFFLSQVTDYSSWLNSYTSVKTFSEIENMLQSILSEMAECKGGFLDMSAYSVDYNIKCLLDDYAGHFSFTADLSAKDPLCINLYLCKID